MPFGYAGTINNWERGIWRRKKRKSQIAIRMIKVVLEMGFRRFTASNDQTQMVVFLTRIRGQQNQGYYPEIADVIMQLDARPRNTRSGRQLQLDVDD
ncbi:hypothetical protein N7486_007635 [Penicillium sp. IBT 16267x]|nr:hypothetical protein N7486_007635 [Penicillium sp. IBT 16267x]